LLLAFTCINYVDQKCITSKATKLSFNNPVYCRCCRCCRCRCFRS
jgi:hypothetical protein